MRKWEQDGHICEVGWENFGLWLAFVDGRPTTIGAHSEEDGVKACERRIKQLKGGSPMT